MGITYSGSVLDVGEAAPVVVTNTLDEELPVTLIVVDDEVLWHIDIVFVIVVICDPVDVVVNVIVVSEHERVVVDGTVSRVV